MRSTPLIATLLMTACSTAPAPPIQSAREQAAEHNRIYELIWSCADQDKVRAAIDLYRDADTPLPITRDRSVGELHGYLAERIASGKCECDG